VEFVNAQLLKNLWTLTVVACVALMLCCCSGNSDKSPANPLSGGRTNEDNGAHKNMNAKKQPTDIAIKLLLE
jgi:hypothetical protein